MKASRFFETSPMFDSVEITHEPRPTAVVAGAMLWTLDGRECPQCGAPLVESEICDCGETVGISPDDEPRDFDPNDPGIPLPGM